MLRGLRKASSNWLGQTVMAVVVGFLVISFAIWGIGDIFRGFGRSTVATIGGTEITIEQFRNLYNDRLQQYSRQLGRPISSDQARQLGLDRIVISQLVSEIVLDERVRALGLGISDAEVSKQITTNPMFQGPNGQFDRFRFEQIIRNAGFTEARFVSEERRRLLRRQLANTVASGMEAPKALVEAANAFQNEQRTIEYLVLDRSRAGELPQPTPEELAKFFDERKVLFRAPEYRKLVVVTLIPSEQARWIEISDADLQKGYDERRARYVTPERRQIKQIDFPDMAAARAAADRIAQGASFDDIAKEAGTSEKDIDLGTVTKAGMIDRAVADAAFALKEGEVSAPVQGRFGTVLVKVEKIEPEQVRTLAEVAPELKQELATARAKAEVLSIYDKVEDARSEGKTLAEAAELLKLPARTIDAIDRSGRDPAGVQVTLPDQQRLLASTFSTDPGVEHDPLQYQDGYLWFDVVGVTPGRERPLDEVKDQVEQRWREQEITKRLEAKANELLEKLKAPGAIFADVAAAADLKVETLSGLKRGNSSGPLSAAAVETVFRTPKDAVAKADGAQPAEQVIFRVTGIELPPFDMASEEAKRLVETLNRGMAEDMLGEYISRLESDIGVTINQSALDQVIGGGTGGIN
ncbi:MAG: SurA N-terminal domain-containing protein [Hyphomicrobiales bacterium]|nr:SurA N-terminal domain-containing protein [Hyphomicrobiales bacterium]